MFRWKLLILALLLHFGACTETTSNHEWLPTIGGIENEYVGEVAKLEESSIAFGKISVLRKGKPENWKTPSCKYLMKWECLTSSEDSFEVVIYSQNGREPLRYMLSGDGSFYWKLPSGKYTLMGFRHVKYIKNRAQAPVGRIVADFSIPENEASVYLGTMAIHTDNGRYGISVVDEFDNAIGTLSENSVELTKLPAKRLFFIDRIDDFENVVNICSPKWGLNCENNYFGVTPSSPKVERVNFPKTKSSMPEFSWEPSTKEDVSYDLIIYEAASFLTSSLRDYFPGRVVKYVKGIEVNQYQLDTPLKEKTKYYWSVRLRQNDTVSTWSAFSYRYFAFFIVGYASGHGSGILFNFETP